MKFGKIARLLSVLLAVAFILLSSGCRFIPMKSGNSEGELSSGDLFGITQSGETAKTEAYTEFPGQATGVFEIPSEAESTSEASLSTKGYDEGINAKADEICGNYGAAGVQVAVIREGKLYGTYEFGCANREEGLPVDSDTKFRVASLSKLVTDCVFLCLADEGKVSLEEDIGKYLGYEVRNPSYPDSVLTPSMLMAHTSSLRDSQTFLQGRQSGSSVPLQRLLSSSESFSGNKPGETHIYSNFGVAVIGAICEKVTGENFDVLAHRYIFDPMGIDASYVASNLKDTSQLAALYGNGGMSVSAQLSEKFHSEIGGTYHLVQGNLTVSAKDYARIIAMIVNGGVADNGKRIMGKAYAEAVTQQRCTDRSFGVGYGVMMAQGVVPEERLCVHTGSNFGMFSSFAFSPTSKKGVVVLTSGAEGGLDYETEIYSVCLDLIRLFY